MGFLSSNISVAFICLGILGSFLWLRSKTNSVVKVLEKDFGLLNQKLLQSNDDPQNTLNPVQDIQNLCESKDISEDIREELSHIKDRIVLIGTDYGQLPFTMDNIRQEFRSHEIVERRLNTRKLEAYPGIFTGVGLLFTFIFLALALYGLGDLKGTHALETVNQVLAAASAKFATSIVGLICGMWMTLFSKDILKRCDIAVEKVMYALSLKVSDRGTEESVQLQLQLMAEVLNESREQVGQLKRFETDFAVSIAGAIDKVMSSRFDNFVASNNAHNERLIVGVAGLTHATERTGQEMVEKIGVINEQALQKMVSDLQSLVRDTMTSEMEEMKAGLKDLSSDLRASGEIVKSAITEAGDSFTDNLKAKTLPVFESISRDLGAASENLRVSGETVKSAIVEAGSSFADTFKEKTLPVLEDISRELGIASESVKREISQAAAILAAATNAASEELAMSGRKVSERLDASSAQMKNEIETATKNAANFFEASNASITNTLKQFNEIFNSTVSEFVAQLNMARDTTRESLAIIVDGLGVGSKEFVKLIQSSSAENSKVTKNLQDAANDVKAVFAGISSNFKDTGNTIAEVINGFQGTGKNLDKTVLNLNANTEKFLVAASSMDSVSQQMQSAAREISSGSESVVHATTNAMARFEDMSKLLTRTNSELGMTLDSMNNGLSTYATKLRDLHQSLDQELAKAISGLENTVGELTETLDDVLIKLDKVEAGA